MLVNIMMNHILNYMKTNAFIMSRMINNKVNALDSTMAAQRVCYDTLGLKPENQEVFPLTVHSDQTAKSVTFYHSKRTNCRANINGQPPNILK